MQNHFPTSKTPKNSRKDYFINTLIAVIPATIATFFIKEWLGLSGVVVLVGPLLLFTYLVGIIRRKIGKRNQYPIERSNVAEKSIGKSEMQEENDVSQAVHKENAIKNKTSKWIIVWIGLAFIVFLIFSILSSSSDSPPKDIGIVNTDKNSDNQEQIDNLYRNTKYNFRIKFPEGWEITSGDGPNILQKAVRGNDSISVGVREIPSELVDHSTTITDVMTLDEFKDSTYEGVQEKFPESKLIDFGESKLDNSPAYWVKYSTTYSVLNTTVEGTIIQYQLLKNNIFYSITAGSIPSEFPKAESEFMKSISTFVIENN